VKHTNVVGRIVLAVLGLWHGLAAIQNFFDVHSFFLIDDALDDYELGAKHRAIFTLVAAGYAAAKAAKA